jgi:protease I
MRALILTGNNFEDSELRVPYDRLRREGIDVDIASECGGKVAGKHGYEVGTSKTFQQIDPDQYDIVLIPGGQAPASFRWNEAALQIVRDFFDKDKPLAAICHGPQVLISAGVLRGKRATCYSSLIDELKGAGAVYEDRAVVVDGNLVTSRRPSDLGPFVIEILRILRQLSRTDASSL